MHIALDDYLSIGWIISQLSPPQLSATFIVKGTFRLDPEVEAVPVEDEPDLVFGDIHWEENEKYSLSYESDFAPFKPRADLLLTGKCYAPGGKPTKACRVTFQVGDRKKTLGVFGDRLWAGVMNTISTPQPFTEMELRYENSYGGERHKKNPTGKGYWKERTDSGEKIWPLPNIEDPENLIRTQRSQPNPAGFGPLGKFWQQRFSKVGSYKGKWLEERWPWFPKDFDWGFFNAAPPDMQVAGYLKGDEKLYFENLHPKHANYESKLPGLRARCFLNEIDPENAEKAHFREVPLKLDTLWVDMETEKLVLVWRGVVDIRTMKLKEIEHIFAIAEPLTGEARDADYYWDQLQDRMRDVEDELAEQESAEVWKKFDQNFAELDKDMAALEKEAVQIDKEFAALEAQVEQAEKETFNQIIKGGVDPATLQNTVKSKTWQEVAAELKAIKTRLAKTNPEQIQYMDDLDLSFLKEMEEMDLAEKKFDEDMAAMEEPPLTRESVQAMAAQKDNFIEKELSKLDLSGMDLSGLDFTRALLCNTNLQKTDLSRANLTGADLSGADLSKADLSDAVLDDSDITQAVLTNTKVTGVSLTEADLSELILCEADFSKCKGEGADFSGADLTHAKFVQANLPQADFSECKLEEADFRMAKLKSAMFYSAKAAKINMEGADISAIQASEQADFSQGNFKDVKGENSIWEESNLDGADFTYAVLTRANFCEASLIKSNFSRAEMSSAAFEDACLDEAKLIEANLLRASFERASLIATNFQRANLYESSFWEAIAKETDFRMAKMKNAVKPKQDE